MHRRLGLPVYAFCPLHELEVPNALRLRLFAASGLPAPARTIRRREVATGVKRLNHFLAIGCLRRTPMDWDAVIARALSLSERFSEKLGSRSLDILHVGMALTLHAEAFLTCDRNQAALAKAAGLSVTLVA